MTLQIELTKQAPEGTELVIEGVAQGASIEGLDPGVAAASGFEGKPGQTVLLPGRLLVGLGEGDPSPDTLRRAAASAARAVGRCREVATTLPATAAVAEGFALGSYTFQEYRSEPSLKALQRIYVLSGGGARAAGLIETGLRSAAAVAVARDLVNRPAGDLTPTAFAAAAKKVGAANGLTVDVLDEKAIKARKLNGLLAVNRGSTQPPRFVELTYEPATAAKATVALVGKGITFDSGGLSMKTPEGMMTMKCDMGGAAAVLGAMSACRDLGVKVRVRGFLPLTDNMTGGDAQRVGDIIRYSNGRTVEVLNTDAEGRLILADGLISACAEKPAAIVDVATLTGACMVALGTKVAGLLSPHDGWAAQVTAAGEAAGEPLWRLPLVDAYRPDLDSKIADLRNISTGRYGGTITAGLFLREFVDAGIPWAHLDIAGPAFNEGADDAEVSSGGTGFGVRTLLALLRSYKKP